MANYTKATDFAAKDALISGNPAKIVKGEEIDDEFNAISTAVNSKSDINSPTFTGIPAAPTAAAGTNTTQIATTAHVYAERSNTATLTNKNLDSTTITLNTTSVLNATAGAAAGAVGTYAWLGQTTTTTYHFGNTLSGSYLKPAGVAAPGSWALDDPAGDNQFVKPKGHSTTIAGTWRCMGESGTGTTYSYGATLWLRIS